MELNFELLPGHREFSSCRQQDASEYFQHFLQLIEREEFKHQDQIDQYNAHSSGDEKLHSSNSLFNFSLEERYQCDITQEVKYVAGQQTSQNILELRISLGVDGADVVTIASASCEEKDSVEEGMKRQKLNEEKGSLVFISYLFCK